MTTSLSPDTVRAYLKGLQQRIIDAIVAVDGSSPTVDPWKKPAGEKLQGNGITQIIEDGPVFERAGCGFSDVSGPALPPSATHDRPELAGAPFEAMGFRWFSIRVIPWHRPST